jgi:4-diphosphocytidyl-2-C-methyl-D-erythritol kinase
MIFFSGCKINLGLRIIEKRADDFHNIETIFYPVNWKDAIEYLPAKETSIEVLGRKLESSPNDNYVIRAYNALKKNYDLPNLQFKLLKNVPAGAGLGGGSANAAATLLQLNKDFQLNISQNDLVEMAASIGSDCAFFLDNSPSHATGRGEILETVKVDLKNYWLLILFPNVHVDTSWAYQTFAQKKDIYNDVEQSLQAIIHQPVSTWKNSLRNDFEALVFEAQPHLEKVKSALYQSGAVYSSLSGSGSSLFGLFGEKPDAVKIAESLEIGSNDWWLEQL